MVAACILNSLMRGTLVSAAILTSHIAAGHGLRFDFSSFSALVPQSIIARFMYCDAVAVDDVLRVCSRSVLQGIRMEDIDY